MVDVLRTVIGTVDVLPDVDVVGTRNVLEDPVAVPVPIPPLPQRRSSE